MSTRLVPVLLLTAMLYALGASVASLSGQPASKVEARQTPAADADIPVLPTVVVRPDDAVAMLSTVTLPTVTVRPSAAEIAAAHAFDTRAIGAGAVVVALHTLGGGITPRSGLDMPYYSFGKSAYRLRKE